MPLRRSAEFAAIVACCRWPLTPAALATIRRRTVGIDWNRFVRLAGRHRVEGLVARALAQSGVVPPREAAEALDAVAKRIAHQNLRLAAESLRLTRAFEHAGIAHLFVKGITLGRLAYGDIARKAGWDIDLLIAPDALMRAAEVLRDEGYALDWPAVDDATAQLPVWHRYSKESIWRHPGRDSWVELHTALTDNPRLLAAVGLDGGSVPVAVSPGITLPTLPTDALFAYLCAHGASSAWFRLKWIADLAALIGDLAPIEIERLYRRAVALDAGRTAAVGLLLAGLLFRPAIGAALWREMRADGFTRLLVGAALRKLTGRAGERELDAVAMGTATIHLTQLGLMRGWRYKRAELARQLVSPIDRVATPLPRGLTWLYPFIQLQRVARRR